MLFLLLLVGMIKQKAFEWIRDKVKLKVFLIVLLYGIILELLQGYVFQGRSIEPLDIAANLVGIGFGFVTRCTPERLVHNGSHVCPRAVST